MWLIMQAPKFNIYKAKNVTLNWLKRISFGIQKVWTFPWSTRSKYIFLPICFIKSLSRETWNPKRWIWLNGVPQDKIYQTKYQETIYFQAEGSISILFRYTVIGDIISLLTRNQSDSFVSSSAITLGILLEHRLLKEKGESTQ